MASRAESTLKVNVVGDADGLSRELGKAEGGVKGLMGSAKGLVGAFALVGAGTAVVEFGTTALAQADRLADATALLELQVGDLSRELIEGADNFTKLGQSAQDILELEVAFANAATAVGLADDKIVEFADDAAATAAAIALLTDMEADTAIDLIGKAADGSAKAMKALGIDVTEAEIVTRALADTGKANAEALTESELAAASYALVLEELKPRLDEVANGSGDVEQRQAELQARWETLTARVGEGIEGPLNDFLGWVLQGLDGLGMMDQFLGLVEQSFRDLLGPIARAADEIRDLIDAMSGLDAFGSFDIPTRTYSGSGGVTLNVVPNDAADTERAVIQAIKDYQNRVGLE
jgi:hypothetical protein